jgi:hypothetical protein
MKWRKAIPDDKPANRILFGEESQSLEALERLPGEKSAE